MNKSNSVSNLVFENLPTEVLSTIVVYADFPPLNRVCKYFSEQSEAILFAPLFHSYKNYQTSFLLKRKVNYIEQICLQASNAKKVEFVYLAIIAGIDRKYLDNSKAAKQGQSMLREYGALSPKRLEALLDLIMTIRLDKKKMDIFDRFFIPLKGSPCTYWEERSFQNGINMKTKEALKLIDALGGRYSQSKRNEPYFVAYLPKIESNGKNVEGEVSESVIVLIDRTEMDFCDIELVRAKLVMGGFTPDTVGPLRLAL